MNLLINLLLFIDSWLGTHLARPTKRFRRRDYFRGMMYNQNYIERLNRHLRIHEQLCKLDPSDNRTKYEHDKAVVHILNNHALSRAAWYNERVFDYVDKRLTKNSGDPIPFYSSFGYFNYPLYQITTIPDITLFLKGSRFIEECVLNDVSIRKALLRDNEEWAPREHLLIKNQVGISEYELNSLDSLLVEAMLRRLVLALSNKSIEQNNNVSANLRTIRNIQVILEMLCFMDGVMIKEDLASALVDKLVLCDLHSLGVVPNQDNPTKRCLAMLSSTKIEPVTLITYIIEDEHSSAVGLFDLQKEGAYIHVVFDSTTLLGSAQYALPVGYPYQWFQYFDFKRLSPSRHRRISDDNIACVDKITDFRSLIVETTQPIYSSKDTGAKSNPFPVI